MFMNETHMVLIFAFSICIILHLLNIFISKSDVRASYYKSIIKINWRKCARYWIYIQTMFLILGSNLDWISIILYPVFIMYLVLLHALFYMGINNDKADFSGKEFKNFEKKFNRDKKIKKVL